ncbi:DUF221-domain-containing protein [Thelephora terrestris]|uniref:DUF221-domain-containing protein n=1 Tax=Thelephora terrestris TaxID=56493 RepID=A0A9P6L9E4_9AGAM|nr:DUF221-domain-containing protein [Thelephora terrestris]
MSNLSSAKSQSTSQFVTALVFNSAVFAIEIAIFTFVRPYFRAIYEPRSYIPIESKRVPRLSQNIFAWPLAIWRADIEDIKRVNGLDAYFFVRFLRMMALMFLPIWFITWAVLIPVTTVNTQVPGLSGLDRLTFGNVESTKQRRYAAHLILAWILTFWVWYLIKVEMAHFVTLRQQYLISKEHATSTQASTILVTGVPRRYLNERALMKLYSYLPGGVRKVWLNRDLKTMPQVYNDRLNACNKLESAETSLLKTAAEIQAKKDKKLAEHTDGSPSIEHDTSLADQLVPRDQRPTHRLPLGFLPFSLPLIGKKVDSIDWAKEEIERTNEELTRMQKVLAKEITSTTKSSRLFNMSLRDMSKELDSQTYPPLNSAFILFNNQMAAHMAVRLLTHHEPYRMTKKYIDVAPQDVVWDNLSMNPYEAQVRRLISYAATAGLIILWAFPVAFIGTLSNVPKLCATYSFLSWLCGLPSVVTGIIGGILPPVLLAVLMALLPIILRLLARFEGIPKHTDIELSLMTRYFIFQVIHSFLIVTLASGIIAALPQLAGNLGLAPTLLARNLPLASNFFLTFVILQGLTATASVLLTLVPLIIYYVKLILLGSTPRSVFTIKYTMRNVQWGTLFPTITLLVVISLGYMLISPIINGFACFTFFFFYQAWKYAFTWQLEQSPASETGGLFFPKAIQHIFAGMYVQQVCLAALFFLAQDQNRKPSAIPMGALMIVLIILTICFNLLIVDSYGPLKSALPLSLADKTYNPNQHDQNGEDEEDPPPESAARSTPDTRTGQDAGNAEYGGVMPAPVEPKPRDEEAEEDEDLNDFNIEGPKDFDHPAAVETQRIVWVPNDVLGLGRAEIEDMERRGIEGSLERAEMDAQGKIRITGPPPGEPEVNVE